MPGNLLDMPRYRHTMWDQVWHGSRTMSIATASRRTRRSLLRHTPLLAAALAAISVLLLGFAPLGWRAGWWHYRFALLSMLPWAAYFGIAAVIVSALALLLG